MTSLSNTTPTNFTLTAKTPPESIPTWFSSNPAVIAMNQSADGMTCTGNPTGASGNVTVTVKAFRLFAKGDYLVGPPAVVTDHPIAVSPYILVSGPLFNGTPKYSDVVQGGLGDCGLMIGFALAAYHHPDIVQSMFTDNGDGTLKVRLFNKGVPQSVTIDYWLPSGYASYANCLWVALAEKAYAEFYGASYTSIAGEYIYDAFNKLTGQTATPFTSPSNEAGFIAAYNAGKMIGFATKTSNTTDGVVPNHAYGVIGFDPASGIVTLYNPWGFLTTLSWAQIVANCVYFDYQIKRN